MKNGFETFMKIKIFNKKSAWYRLDNSLMVIKKNFGLAGKDGLGEKVVNVIMLDELMKKIQKVNI